MKGKTSNIQQWIIRRKSTGEIFILSYFFKKTPWLGLEAAIFNSKASIYLKPLKNNERLRDVINDAPIGICLNVVFTKWEDSSQTKNRNGATNYVLINEDKTFSLKSEEIEIILEI